MEQLFAGLRKMHTSRALGGRVPGTIPAHISGTTQIIRRGIFRDLQLVAQQEGFEAGRSGGAQLAPTHRVAKYEHDDPERARCGGTKQAR